MIIFELWQLSSARDLHRCLILISPWCRACSQPAVGFETLVTISIAEESFVTTGETSQLL